MSTKPVLTSFTTVAPLIVQQYERYLPTAFDDSLTILQKMGKIIEYLNQIGEITNGIVEQWNEVMEWVMNDGLNAAVIAKLDEMLANGIFDDLINETIFNDLNTKIEWRYNAKHPFPANLPKAAGDGVTDDTDNINAIFEYVMKNGGGEVFFPAGTYIINGTIYTHSDSYVLDDSWGSLTLTGASPLSFSLYSAKAKNVTIFKKTTNGVLLSCNHTPTQDNVLPNGAVFRNFTVEKIMFEGTGVKDGKYSDMYGTIAPITAIQLHRTSLFIRDCLFDKINRGIYANDKQLDGKDNYCDQSRFERLGFRNMGYSWIEGVHADASHFSEIYGYRMAKTCTYGIRIVKGESFSIERVLCSAKEMHLLPSFKLVSIYFANAFTLREVYGENIEGIMIDLDNVDNVVINTMGARHYKKTMVKGRSARNVKIENVYSYTEEDKQLSANDTGDFTTYDTITPPVDFDFDNTCYNIEYGHNQFIHAVHNPTTGSFNKVSTRFFPKVNKTAFGERGQEYNFLIFGESGVIKFRVNGQTSANPEYLLGATIPTFNLTTSELTFPATGIFENKPVIQVSGRRSGGTSVLNVPYIINDTTIRILTPTGTLLTNINDVALNVSVRF